MSNRPEVGSLWRDSDRSWHCSAGTSRVLRVVSVGPHCAYLELVNEDEYLGAKRARGLRGGVHRRVNAALGRFHDRGVDGLVPTGPSDSDSVAVRAMRERDAALSDLSGVRQESERLRKGLREAAEALGSALVYVIDEGAEKQLVAAAEAARAALRGGKA